MIWVLYLFFLAGGLTGAVGWGRAVWLRHHEEP